MSHAPTPGDRPGPRRRALLGGAAALGAAAVAATPMSAAAAPGRGAGHGPGGDGAAGPGAARRGRPRCTEQRHHWRTAMIGGTGFVTGLLFHPAVPGLAYARTDIGGAYRWDDSTARWTPLNDDIGWDDWNLLGVEAMAVDPAHPDRLYLALGTYTQSWAGPGAVFRSEDRGATWARTDLTVRLGANEDGRGAGERLAVDPRDSEVLWLGTRNDGLWRSDDRGASWRRADFPATPAGGGQGVTWLLAAGRELYAGWGEGGTALYRTRGDRWEPVPGQPSAGAATRTPIRAAYDAGDGALYVSYASGPGPNDQTDGSVHRLDVATGVWRDVTPVRPGGSDPFGYGGVAVAADRPGTVVVSTNNRWGPVDTLYRSTDGGASWTSLKESAVLDVSETPYLRWGEERPKFGWWIQTVAVNPFDSRHIVFGTGATVYGTRDLTHWAPQIRGLEESSVRLLLAPPGGGAQLLSALGDIGVMRHDSLTASPAAGMAANPVHGTATGLALAAADPSYVVRTGWGTPAGAWSRDGGRSWQPFAAQPDIAPEAPGPIAVTADGAVLIWVFVHWDGTGHPGYRSTDNGASWHEIPGYPRGATPVADPVDPAVCYAYDTTAGTLTVSTDRGATFAPAATGLPAGDPQFAVEAAPGRRGELWLCGKEHGLLRSTDAGATFTPVAGIDAAYTLGFGRAAPWAPAGHPALYLVGRVTGGDVVAVLRSDDAARTWVRINDDAHQWGWIGETVTGDPRRYGRVYLGTNGRGIQYADPA